MAIGKEQMLEDTLPGPCLTTLNGYMVLQRDLDFTMLILPHRRELQNCQLVGTNISLQDIKPKAVIQNMTRIRETGTNNSRQIMACLEP